MAGRGVSGLSGSGRTWGPMSLPTDSVVRNCLLVLAVLAVLAAASVAQAVLVPFMFAVVFAAILSPLTEGLRMLRVPAFVGAALVVLTPLVAIGWLVQTLLPQVAVWRHRLPIFIQSIELKLGAVKRSLTEAREIARQVQEIAGDGEQEVQIAADQGTSMAFLWDLPALLTSFSITLILTIFLLAVAPVQIRRLGRGRPFGPRLSRALAVSGQRLTKDIARYYTVVAAVNVGLGLATWLAMALLDMPQPYLWGIIGGVVNFVPYAGPVVGTGIIAIVALISFDATVAMILPPLTYIALTTVEGYLVTPTLVGRSLTLEPLLVLLSVVFWSWLWGVAGAFLAVPMLIVTLRLAGFPVLLTGRPVRRPSDGLMVRDKEAA